MWKCENSMEKLCFVGITVATNELYYNTVHSAIWLLSGYLAEDASSETVLVFGSVQHIITCSVCVYAVLC